MMLREGWIGGASMMVSAMACVASAGAAEMVVGDQQLRPATSGAVFVSGSIANESTFGWTILVDLVPRDGASGSVAFTPVLESATPGRPTIAVRRRTGRAATVSVNQLHPASLDVRQVRDVWPGLGTFTPFDTKQSGSPARNGAVDDNGTLVAAPVTYSGVLASFPIQASVDAAGVWDVVLYTDVGGSGFEGVATALIHGSITVTPDACTSENDCHDQDSCTRDSCRRGACHHAYNEQDCHRRRAGTLRPGASRK